LCFGRYGKKEVQKKRRRRGDKSVREKADVLLRVGKQEECPAFIDEGEVDDSIKVTQPGRMTRLE
jgi:hypothetical protein